MQYIVKKGDSLWKISAKHHAPISAILTLNPQITNPNFLFVGQIINIPNTSDVPLGALFDSPANTDDLIMRALSVTGLSIKYKLGSGGMHPGDSVPTRDSFCDCSGFICWVLGLARKTDLPFYKRFGGWIYTDSMESDVQSIAGIFEKVKTPEPGCIVVYGAGQAIGHVGLVTEVKLGKMTKVVHCSAGNDSTFGIAIGETKPNVFNRADAVWGRFTG